MKENPMVSTKGLFFSVSVFLVPGACVLLWPDLVAAQPMGLFDGPPTPQSAQIPETISTTAGDGVIEDLKLVLTNYAAGVQSSTLR